MRELFQLHNLQKCQRNGPPSQFWERLARRPLAYTDNALMSAVSENNTGTNTKTEIVPSAIIVGLVDTDVLIEETNNESNWSNNTMPETAQKSSRLRTFEFVF
jgi:hypothetical protein